jgi:hypothetical protein
MHTRILAGPGGAHSFNSGGGYMTTLIKVYNGDVCVGRCDGRCYDADKSYCDCICGGANHGVGLDQAIFNTAAMLQPRLDDWGLTEQLQRFKQLRGLHGDALRVHVPAFQLQLF